VIFKTDVLCKRQDAIRERSDERRDEKHESERGRPRHQDKQHQANGVERKHRDRIGLRRAPFGGHQFQSDALAEIRFVAEGIAECIEDPPAKALIIEQDEPRCAQQVERKIAIDFAVILVESGSVVELMAFFEITRIVPGRIGK
jgi:hypothetical protein